jgi:hypothetical protein
MKPTDRDARRRTADAYTAARAAAERTEAQVLRPIERWFDDETGRVTTMLRRHFKGRLNERFSPQYLAPIRARLEAHFAGVAQRLEGKLQAQRSPLLASGVQDVTRLVGKLSGREPPTGVTERVVAQHATALDRLRADSARSLAQQLGDQTWRGLRAVFEAQTDPRHLIVLAGELLDQQDWRVKRLVATETSYAYNLAQAAALRAYPTDPGDLLWGRWQERVDDLTGRPLDKQVAPDSLVLHGQVTRPGGVFTMPNDPRAGRLAGRSWAHPPNRPHDRAVLVPWQRSWGVPGWILQGGKRIDLSRLDPGRAVGMLAESP